MSRGEGWVKNLKMVILRVLKPLVLDLAEKALKIHPWCKHVFSKNASVEFILCDFIKKELHHRDYLAWALQGTVFIILENSLHGITVFLLYRRL